jgi:serine/threonine protein kinase
MNAQSRLVQTDAWTQWESQVVNGVYPLRRFLGGSNHSAVFLTEYKAERIANAAIKFVPADTLQAQAQLVQWGTAVTLSHPHLVRLFDVGRCRFGGREFLFVVMEYADQTLAQVLPQRALSPEEAQELLIPTLDALAFLHQRELVHGRLKPSNFLVVDDQLKLAGDTISSVGKPSTGTVSISVYDPPDQKDGAGSTAADVWDLGILLVEALTQRPPLWPDERAENAILPVKLPQPFLDIVRRCLSRPAANRPTALELQAHYKPTPWVDLDAPLLVARSAPPPEDTEPRQSRYGRLLITAISAIAAAVVITLGIWVSFHVFQKRPHIRPFASGDSQEYLQQQMAAEETATPAEATPTPASPAPDTEPSPDAATAQSAIPGPNTPAPPTATRTAEVAAPSRTTQLSSIAQPAVAQSTAPPGPIPPNQLRAPATADSNPVVYEEIPEIIPSIRARINGHVRVAVRVLVDPSGNVVGEFMESAGPSPYFARLAADAAGKWQFIPTDAHGSRVWLLRFEFTREGATAEATGT